MNIYTYIAFLYALTDRRTDIIFSVATHPKNKSKRQKAPDSSQLKPFPSKYSNFKYIYLLTVRDLKG